MDIICYIGHGLITFFVNRSWHAIRIRADVAGDIKLNFSERPSSLRASLIASLMANKMDEAKNNGGSPTAFDE